tara:strand:- start:182 stop:433 length:252 start_codon:yes stop_codon:yes gene_type:complete
LRYADSKNFVKSELKEEAYLNTVSEFSEEDVDPLSIRSFSITFVGFTIALMTILIPMLSVLLGRPLSQETEITFIYSIKKDGS